MLTIGLNGGIKANPLVGIVVVVHFLTIAFIHFPIPTNYSIAIGSYLSTLMSLSIFE